MRVGASKLAALFATILLTYSLAPVAPAAADNNLCKPSGKEGAIALPRKLATANRPQEDKYTTADVEPLSSVNIDALGLRTPRTLTVGTQPGGPPTSCLNTAGRYTGYDNELLRAIAAKLGLQRRLRRHRILRAARPGRGTALRRRLVVDHRHRSTPSHSRIHQWLRLRLPVADRAVRFADRRLRRPGRRAADRRGSGHRRRGLRRRHPAHRAGEIPRLHHRVHQREDPPDRRVGGAGHGGGQRRCGPATPPRSPPTRSAWATSWRTRWPKTTSR